MKTNGRQDQLLIFLGWGHPEFGHCRFWYAFCPLQAESDGAPPQCRSVLLFSEKNMQHGIGILRFLKRAGAQLPLELQSLVQDVLVAREEQKLERPLCGYLKSFGVCRSLMGTFSADPTFIASSQSSMFFLFLFAQQQCLWKLFCSVWEPLREDSMQVRLNVLASLPLKASVNTLWWKVECSLRV